MTSTLHHARYSILVLSFIILLPLLGSFEAKAFPYLFFIFNKEKKALIAGHAYEHEGDYNNAISTYTKALVKYPYSFKLYYARGNARLEAGDVQGAINDFEMAIALNENFIAPRLKRASANFDLKLYQESLNELLDIVLVDPMNKDIHYMIGANYLELGDTAKAEVYLNNAVDIDHKFGFAYLKLGIIEIGKHEYDEARRLVNKSIRYSHTNSVAFKWKGLLCEKDGHRGWANHFYQKAVRLGYLEKYGSDIMDMIANNDEKRKGETLTIDSTEY